MTAPAHLVAAADFLRSAINELEIAIDGLPDTTSDYLIRKLTLMRDGWRADQEQLDAHAAARREKQPS